MTLTTQIVLAIVIAAVLTMPAYFVAAKRRTLDPDVERRPATILLGRWIRDWLMWLIAPLERVIVASGISPDALNITGTLLGAAAGVAYARGALELGGLLVLLGGAADVLDGRVARARGLASDYGEFIDSVLDRFAETFTFLGIGWYWMPLYPSGTLLTAAALAGSLLVSYTRAKGDAVGVEIRGGLMQRAERLVLLAVASIFGVPIGRLIGDSAGGVLFDALFLIALGAFATVAWRGLVIARQLKERARRS